MPRNDKEHIKHLCEFIEDDAELIASLKNEPLDDVHAFLHDNGINTQRVLDAVPCDAEDTGQPAPHPLLKQLQHIFSQLASKPALSFSLAIIVGIIGLQYLYPEPPAPPQERGLSSIEVDPSVDPTAEELENLNAQIMELYEQRKFGEAEALVRQVLETVEDARGADHLDTAHALNNLAVIEKQLGKLEQADEHYRRALSIQEDQLGKTHPGTLTTRQNLGRLYEEQGHYKKAESIYQEIFETNKAELGPSHGRTIDSRNHLIEFYQNHGNTF
ncbi:MAG: tetratricopeptide repeat protein [Candidatus Omnitrophica bacterium]|nr:tetratricopeptide repeat protein [Candidatus Omnitrophota bacterium]